MANQHWHSLDRAALRALMHQFKRDDWLVLDDETLLAALDGSHPLSRVEWAGLLESPLTLKRMAALEAGRRKQAGTVESPLRIAAVAANDELYSCALTLLAADSGEQEVSLSSADGWWQLSCPATHGGWKMRLELAEGAPFVGLFEDEVGPGMSPRAVAVLDGRGRTLLLGHLNDERLLWGNWPLAESPREALAPAGGVFQVRLV